MFRHTYKGLLAYTEKTVCQRYRKSRFDFHKEPLSTGSLTINGIWSHESVRMGTVDVTYKNYVCSCNMILK